MPAIEGTGTGPSSDGEALAFPIVGIGASAGGLEALRDLFGHLPASTGMGFVVIQHLDPERPSMLASVLQGATPLRVVEVTEGMRVEPDRVHVIPPGFDIRLRHAILELVLRQKTGGLHLPIDTFFRSLAGEAQRRAIGVVLSGSGTDGTQGLREIKSEGGIAIAQEPDSAQFRSMPESAIEAGVVDIRATPEAIAVELARLARHPYVAVRGPPEAGPPQPPPDQDGSLGAVLALLRQRAGIDFSGYKRSTVLRRIDRRMALRQAPSLVDYAGILRDDPLEAAALAQDMLIHVTSFFRDPESYAALKEQALAELVERKKREEDASIRIWVPGCSTGEEAYGIAISLLELLDAPPEIPSIKIFGTDVSEQAIEAARRGVYPDAGVATVSAERLSRFFERVEGGYRIGKQVRDLCVFVKHDLIRDPPFARLDLVSCRNVLIYFAAELQRQVLGTLHHCLNERGYLFLGRSETITGVPDLFSPVSAAHRIFVRMGASPRPAFPIQAFGDTRPPPAAIAPAGRPQPVRDARRQADHFLLARYAPPAVVVNDRMEIIEFRGRTGDYLEPAPGQPQANLLSMAREGLAPHLHEAIERARVSSATVHKEGLHVRSGPRTLEVSLEVMPLAIVPGSAERHFLVVFEEQGEDTGVIPVHAPVTGEDATQELERLRSELVATRDYLQSIISEYRTTKDELAATNEELVAANEELQSANEELQSAKEELQSTNEELTTLNDQLRRRNAELDQVASDLVNVLDSVEIPVIIVDLRMRVRRFTPTSREVVNLIAEDVGRPIDDLKLRVRVDDLPARIGHVLRTQAPGEWEVQSENGRWMRMHIRPYRAADARLDGAVLTFVDVDALRRALAEVESARDYARSIVETVTQGLVVLDAELRLQSANDAFRERYPMTEEEARGRSLFDLGDRAWDTPAVREALEGVLTRHAAFTGVEITPELPRGGRRTFSLAGRPLLWPGGAPMILLAVDDITELRALERERAQLLDSEKSARIEADRANRAKDFFLATLSHELRTPLSIMLVSAQLLEHFARDDPRIGRATSAIERAVKAQARLIDDLLDVSRIVSGKLLLELGPVSLSDIVRESVEAARPSAQAKTVALDLVIEGEIGRVYGDNARLLQVVGNLLTNSIKFTPPGGRISVQLERKDGRAELTVHDTGIGFRPEVLPHLFERFVQADSSATRIHGGLGLGLSIVRHLVEVHGGEVHAESPGEGKGATFRVSLPLGLPEDATRPAGPRQVARGIEGVRVLLVEDDDDTREAYAGMLSALGAEVRPAASAEAGMVAVLEFRPQVILSDIAMPGEDGYSFIQRVRALGPARGGQVPAAAVTALASEEDRQRALRAGFQMHVAKPLDSARLAAVVGSLAAMGGTARGSADSVG